MYKICKINKYCNIIYIAVFMSVISLPLIGSFYGWDLIRIEEKRKLAICPSFKIDPINIIPEKFEIFYKDHFGFRNILIKSHNWIKYKLLKGSSVGNVLLGKDNWLFLSKSGMIIDYLGQDSLTNKELNCWKDWLENRQKWLQERQIRHLFVIAPNKITIYPEQLPNHLCDDKGRTQMDQLLDYLHENSTVEFLDLRKPLQQAKETGLVYYPNDTHWTDWGIFVVYTKLCDRVAQWFPDVQPYSIENFTIETERHKGDLATMLGLGDELSVECKSLIPLTSLKSNLVDFELPEECIRGDLARQQIATETKGSKRRLLIFHDSFWTRGELYKLTAEHFSRIVCVDGIADTNILKVLVEFENPDIVIEEIAERKLKDIVSNISDYK